MSVKAKMWLIWKQAWFYFKCCDY